MHFTKWNSHIIKLWRIISDFIIAVQVNHWTGLWLFEGSWNFWALFYFRISQGTDLLFYSNESRKLERLSKALYHHVRWDFSNLTKKCDERTSLQILSVDSQTLSSLWQTFLFDVIAQNFFIFAWLIKKFARRPFLGTTSIGLWLTRGLATRLGGVSPLLSPLPVGWRRRPPGQRRRQSPI